LCRASCKHVHQRRTQYARCSGQSHGLDAQAMPPRVLDEHGSRVEAHGLVVQDGRGEDRQVVELQPRRGIGDQCEAGGMDSGKP